MNIEDEITVKAGLRNTKVLVEFSPTGHGYWRLERLSDTREQGDMDVLELMDNFGTSKALAKHVEEAIYAKHGPSEIIQDEGEPIPYMPILPASFETPLNFREAA
ncbi:hypothetical protein LH426_15695 [Laribacter hongkongensis]|uniref:hypothetical protein n=1 Tax=Laribacter hongkongensis TaxID=168471 RepID=UPI001EFC9C99|nr:hypothetical protein [Laribacter hongkongensis]MCG8999778.1 hypothetical protein [Laribacter hongkongensis]MCG9005888.1 hypothetical protein [Laribacter hongkongensis]MCG9021265.1 hypothetical protein [Laribacter hongkongensis]MCG9030433.1 hypothetical protein [Laribacter hongkongensis]MCG9036346.1 hypothetical protein [Laribacter hongkongensis]